MTSGSGETIVVGHALCTPGSEPPAGPTAIKIAAGKIAAIEPLGADHLDASNAGLVVLPAPTNAHDHGRGLRTLGFGAVDDQLEAWVQTLSLEPRVDPYLSAVVAFARLAESGVCATNYCHASQDRTQMVEEAKAISRAAKMIGIRVAFAVPFMNRNRGVYGDVRKLLRRMRPEDRARFMDSTANPEPIESMLAATARIAGLEHDLFKVQYQPVGPQWVSDDALTALARASAETGRRIHMHMFETKRQRDWADHTYAGGLVEFLDKIGFLSPRLTLAHGVWLRPRESELLSKRGVSLSINLSSNLRLRSGLPPIADFREVGLRFGVGLDSTSFDDDEDLLREIRLLWRLYRGFGQADLLSQRDVFDAALLHGRRTVVGDDSGGRLRVGAPADLMILDLAAMSRDFVSPHFDIGELLLTRMTKRYVKKLVVAGKEVVRDGHCVALDRQSLEEELWDTARAARAANPPDTARIARLQSAIASYYRAELHKEARIDAFVH